MAQRKSPLKATLHDQVEALYLLCFENPDFVKLREPLFREQTVEGSFVDDDVRAAEMIRDKAREQNLPTVMNEKLSIIRKSIQIVERRYNTARQQRLDLAGE